LHTARFISIIAWVGLLVAVLGAGGFLGALLLRSDADTEEPDPTATQERAAAGNRDVDSLRIISVVPKDAIVAILDPGLVSGKEADGQMRDTEMVIGVSLNGDSRAYSIAQLGVHEIVNDVVGGVPVAVTW
jgi:hypothetical protein